MPRETFSTLQTMAQQYVGNDTSSATLTFLQNELNRAKTFCYADIGDYVTQRIQTTTTQLDMSGNPIQYYHLPVDCKLVEDCAITIGGVIYNLEAVDSVSRWDYLNSINFQGTSIPEKYFARKRDFGIWPQDGSAGDTITLMYQLLDKNMQYSDYTTGTVTVTNNSQSLVGSGTSFTSAFVGRWFQTTADGFWYKISSFTDSTHLTLETSFEGTTASSQAYTIGDSPDLPEELHALLPMRAAAMYYGGFRKDFDAARYWNNFFFTGDPEITATQVKEGEIDSPGGYLSIKATYASRTTDLTVRRGNEATVGVGAFPWDVPNVTGV